MTEPRPLLSVPPVPAPPDDAPPLVDHASRPEAPLARELPPWDLVPSDLLLVRRRPVKP